MGMGERRQWHAECRAASRAVDYLSAAWSIADSLGGKVHQLHGSWSKGMRRVGGGGKARRSCHLGSTVSLMASNESEAAELMALEAPQHTVTALGLGYLLSSCPGAVNVNAYWPFASLVDAAHSQS